MKTLNFEKKYNKVNKENKAGFATLVIKDGKTVFKQTYGLRNIKEKKPINFETSFRLASLSKQFTATCIAILEEQNKLSKDDLICKYFTDFPDCMNNITIGNLLYHTSGIPDYYKLCSTDKSAPLLSNKDIYNFYKTTKQLNFKPGDQFEYSNGGYNLLASLIEHITQISFSQFIQDNLFAPLKMSNAKIIKYPIDHSNYSTSYSEWPFFEDIDFNTGNALLGEDGVYCSINDLEKWIQSFSNQSLLSKEIISNIFRSGKNSKGENINYGYGWELRKYYKYDMFFHTGTWVGFNNIITYFPEEDFWIVVLSNSLAIYASKVMDEIAKDYLDTHPN